MLHIILFMSFTAASLSVQPTDDAIKKEIQLFQGKWTLTGGQDVSGTAFDADTLKKMIMVIDGNKFRITKGDDVTIEGTFTVDPTKKLKTIDVSLTIPKADEKTIGIYQIDGDTRKSCFAVQTKDGARPDGFRLERGYLILEWKRAK